MKQAMTLLQKQKPSAKAALILAAIAAIAGIYIVFSSLAGSTTVNNSTVGTGTNQFEFVGTWTAGTDNAAYGADEHYSNAAGAYYQVRFSGTQVKVYTTKDVKHGIAGVSIDGGPETMVDTYSSTRTHNALVYTSPVLAEAAHTIKVRVTGNKNAAATDAYIIADRVEITSSVEPPTSGSFSVAAVGDMNPENNTYTGSASGKNAAAISAGLADGSLRAFFGLGDFQYGTTVNCSTLTNHWGSLWKNVIPKTYHIAGPYHDWDSASERNYREFWSGACAGQPAKSAAVAAKGVLGPGDFYSFDIGNWHFAALSTGLWQFDTTKANQVTTQLDNDLAAAKAAGKHLAVLYHDPYFTTDTSGHTREFKVKPWVDVIDKHDVRLTLSGSQHNYERSCPVLSNDTCTTDDGTGTTAFQVSTGGISLRPFLSTSNPSYIVKRFADTQGWLKLNFNDDGSFSWLYNPVTGTGTDSGSRVKPGGNPPTGTTYYINCNAVDDSKDGKSETNAWKSLAKANAAPLVSGDKLLLNRGCTWSPALSWSGSLNVKWSGVAVGNYGSGELPRITTAGVSGILVKISGSNNIIDGLRLEGPNISGATHSLYGFQLDTGRGNTIKNSYVTGTHSGVKITSGASLNKVGPNNSFVNNKLLQTGTGTNDDNGAYGIALLGNDNEIFQNYFEGNNAPSTDYGGWDGSAIELYTQCGAAPASNNKIHHNTSVNDNTFSEQGRDTGTSCTTIPENNTYAYNKYTSSGISNASFLNLRGGSGSGGFGGFNGSKAYNNAAYITGSSISPVICSGGCDASHMTYRNNIIVATQDISIGSAAASNNHIYIPGSSDSRYNVNPNFVNLAGKDFHLTATSPAINTGHSEPVTAGFNKDFDFVNTPIGSAVDKGIYEYGGTTPTDSEPPKVSMTSPAGGATVSGTIPVSANATDNVGVVGVQFKLDGANLGAEDTTSPYTMSWNTSTASNGTHTLTAVARDAAGNPGNSVSVTVSVNNIVSAGIKLLIADDGYVNSDATGGKTKRLLITDENGNVEWKFENPTGTADYSSGPLGVRWLGKNSLGKEKILATFGTGQVGIIDKDTKTWDCKISGFGNDYFRSPYDAEILPDGKLALALRYGTTSDQQGQVAVFDYSLTTCSGTGQKVWQHNIFGVHSVKYRPAGYNTSLPTLLISGFGSATDESDPGVKEVTYDKSNYSSQKVVWSAPSEWSHDAMVVEDDNVLLANGWHISKVKRIFNPASDYSERIWDKCVKDEAKRFAINPNGGYVVTVNEERRSQCDGALVTQRGKVEFRDTNGNLIKSFSELKDPTVPADAHYAIKRLDYAYGLDVISDKTTPPADTTPPSVTISNPGNGVTVSGTITATATATDNVGVVGVQFKVDGVKVGTEDIASPYDYTLNTLTLSNGTHYIEATARDAAGNYSNLTSSPGSKISINVQNADTTPPNPPTNLTGVTTQPTASTPSSVALTWPAATDNSGGSGIKGYYVYRNGAVISPLVTATTYNDINVSVGTHGYVVRSVDNAGITSTTASPSYSTTIHAPADNEAPTTPSNLSAVAATSSQVDLSWTGSTDTGGSGVKGYNVYRDGAATPLNGSALIATLNYGDGTVQPNKTYTYQVEAVDGAGNKSAKTVPVSVTTPSSSGILSINDGTTGTSDNQFEFVGVWTDNNAETSSYGGDEHYAYADASYQVRFNGTKATVYTTKDPRHGIAAISIDGGPETLVDTYAASRTYGAVVYTSPVLTDGPHILKVRVTGTKNAAATDTAIVADRVDVATSTSGRVTLAFQPTDDAYVSKKFTTRSFGANSQLKADASPDVDSLLKFTVTGVGAKQVKSAKLRLYVNNSSRTGGSLYRLQSHNWSESSVNWNNAPSNDSTSLAAFGPLSNGSFVEIDLASFVVGDGTYGIKLTSASTDDSGFNSKEAFSNPPRLILTAE